MALEGKKITVGITGGIAAYKAAEIVSWLKAAGADVQVAMTAAACQIITPLTLKTLSGRPVATDLMDTSANWHVPHIDLADCELFLLLPATANIMAKAAHGLADDLVSAALLANHGQVLCAPAMNTYMYENPATQENMRILQDRGWIMIEPDNGRLACGAVGRGRLADIDTIKKAVSDFFDTEKSLVGQKVIVTAGPTYEYIDPVRFIGNRSSGKMGYALAKAAVDQGAEVILISGPVDLAVPRGVRLHKVVSALEMREQVLAEYQNANIVIMAAAVADYRPAAISEQKLKKNTVSKQLELIPNPDILAELGRNKGDHLLIGFAAETQNLEQYAKHKLEEKNLDLIIANNVLEEGAGFDVDTNIITAVYPDKIAKFPKMSKQAAATEIINLIAGLLA